MENEPGVSLLASQHLAVLSKRNSISVFCFDFDENRGKSCKNARIFKMIEMRGKSQ